MKPKYRLLLLSLGVTFAHTASGAVQTWLTANANNTWDLTQANWDAGVVWTNGNDALFTGAGETITIGAAAITAGSFTVNGTGEWKFSGPFANLTAANIFVNTTAGGKLSLTNSGGSQLTKVPNITVSPGTSVYVDNTVVTSAISINGTGNTENRGALRVDGGAVLSGPITLLGDSTIGSNSGTGNITTGGISGAFSLSRSATGGGTLNITAPITITGGFTHNPTDANATTILAGVNTYPGTTTLQKGILSITGSIANSDLTTSTATTVRGEGTAKSLTFGIAGADIPKLVADASTAGTLNTPGALAVNGTLSVDLTSATTTPGPVPILTFGSTTTTPANYVLTTPGNYRQGIFAVNATTVTLDVGKLNLVWSGATATWEAAGADLDWNAGVDKFYNQDSVTFDDTGANPAIAITGSLSPSAITANSSTNNYAFSATAPNGLTGPATLTKGGSSTLSFSFIPALTGAITINGGTLLIDTTAFTGTQNPFPGNAPLTLGSNTLHVKLGGAGNDAAALQFTRPLTGTGTLNLEANALTGNREFTLLNTTTAFGGTINLTRPTGANFLRIKAPTLGNTTQISIADGTQFWDGTAVGQTVGYTFTKIAGTGEAGIGALRAAGSMIYNGNMVIDNTVGGRIGMAGGTASTLNGVISGGALEFGSPSFASAFIVTNAANTPASVAILGNTTIQAGANTIFGSGTLSQKGGVIHSSNTTAHTFANPYVITANIGLGNATNNGKLTFTNAVNLSAITSVITTNSDAEFSGTVSNGSITHAGAGKLILSGAGTTLLSLLKQAGAGSLDIGGTVTISGGTLFETSGAGTATVNVLAGGSFTNNVSSIIAQNVASHNGVLNVAGTFTQTAQNFYLGNNVATANGTLNVNSGGLVTFAAGMNNSSASGTALASGVVLGRDGAIGTINLGTGGIIASAKDIIRGTGTATFNFNGGTLRALASSATVLGGLTTATINAGAIVDTNTFNLTIGQPLLLGTGSGGVTKNGAGTLTLGGSNTYVGETVVNAGTLALNTATLDNASTVRIANSAVLHLPHGAEDTVDKLFIGGSQLPAGIYGSGSSGATIVDNTHFTGTGRLKVITGGAGPTGTYGTWANLKGLTTGNNLPFQDADNDGLNNLAEFAFDGTPTSGNSDKKIVQSVVTLGGQKVLTLTLPVRTDTAAFSGSTEKVGIDTIDALTYRIQGSNDLMNFNLVITEIIGTDATTIQTGLSLPLLSDPAKWSYRTFRTPGPVTTVPKEFIRAKVDQP